MIARPGRHTILFRVNVVVSMAFCLLVALAFGSIATAQNPVPLINQPLVPDAATPSGAGLTLTVNGTGFVSGSVVHWNGSARATTFVSPSKLTATIAASDIAKPTTASVTVVNPGTGGRTSNDVFFQITTASLSITAQESDIRVGAYTERSAVGDFNGDGKLDLAVADYLTGIWVLLGKGDGTFQNPVFYSVPSGTGYLIVGDFNNDGKLDIASQGHGIVSVLLGNGDGTFRPHIDSAIDSSIPNPVSIAAGDLNRDGNLDLVVGYQGGSAISVLLGKGDGSFQPFVDYATDPEPNAVVVGDFNSDGNLDVATGNFGNFGGHTVSILLGNGDGTLRPAVSYQTDQGPLSIVAADFNGDGKLDLAVDCSSSGTVSVLLGKGDGTFQPAVNYAVDKFPYTIVAGDFNGDRKLDLALTDLDSGEVSFLLGKGDGTFQPHHEFSTNARPVGLVTGDFNGDGTLDLVVGGSNPENVAIMLVSGTAVTLSPARLNFGTVGLGQHKTLTSIMTNVGNTTLHITSLTIVGTYFSETNNCGSALAPHQSCDINVTFVSQQFGDHNGTVSITDDGGGSPQEVSLFGRSNIILPKYCRCGGPCTIGCLLRCGCHNAASEALLEQEPSSPVSCNANWSDRLPEFRERH